jgi:ribonucleoside-diphosphate reductase alpha chain
MDATVPIDTQNMLNPKIITRSREMTFFHETIAAEIWDTKYRYRYLGQTIDQTVEDTWIRVAKAAAKVESPQQRQFWQKQFHSILENFRFLPGGRILAGAGTKLHVTLFNCFVMNIAEDSLSGIFDALEEGAITLQQGGGVGYDFSILRPRGQIVKKTGIASSGPISFMRIWNTMCGILLSTGTRRGAMMSVLRCDHPDIEEFITAKADPQELRHFNVSVLVSDAFMQAVKADDDWALVFPLAAGEPENGEIIYKQWSNQLEVVPCRVYRRVKARALWQQITRSAYDYAEPGVLFEDTINRMNTLWYREKISATNPCGEIPLPPYGACNLGAINLTQFVINAYTKEAALDWDGIKNTSHIATRFLDNIIDVSRYPLKAQKQEAIATRRIGLGFTGLADVFVMLGMRYGSEESLQLANKIMKTIAEATWDTSIALAAEKGAFPLYQADSYLGGEFVKKLPAETQAKIAQHGVRNSHHNTIAPTGTISLLANNVSSGIEPIFSAAYERYVLEPSGERKKFTVIDYALRQWQQLQLAERLPPAWIDSQTLTPKDHLAMQGAVQSYIDNAISKTINLPEDFPFDELHEVYSQAYAMGLKGCTIYRPNPITGSVLQSVEPEEDVERCCQIS